MIIFGYRGMVKLLGMVTLVCQRCGNPAAHRVVRHSRWFTLFFIPIFPFSISRSMTCTFCGQGTRLSKDQADQVLGVTAQQQAPVGPAAEQLAGAPHLGAQPYPGQPYPDQPYPGQQPTGQYLPPQQYGAPQAAPSPQPQSYPQQNPPAA